MKVCSLLLSGLILIVDSFAVLVAFILHIHVLSKNMDTQAIETRRMTDYYYRFVFHSQFT
jgi:hypothetical protein